MKRQRLDKIDHLIQRELARIIREDLKDPRLGFVTVTRVETAADLSHAKVYVGCIGDRHQVKQSLLALESAKRFLRGELGEAVDLRHTPELQFIEDRSAEKAIAVTHMIDSVVQPRPAQSERHERSAAGGEVKPGASAPEPYKQWGPHERSAAGGEVKPGASAPEPYKQWGPHERSAAGGEVKPGASA